MENFFANPWFIGFATTIIGGLILTFIGKWRGWWWRTKSSTSIELVTRSLIIFDGEVEEKTKELISLTKRLGDSLVASCKIKIAHDKVHETGALSLITELLTFIKPLVTELSANERELDNLKRAVIAFQESLQSREQIIKHLCHPPNPSAIDPGHIRAQLLDDNRKLHDLLNSAKGEAIIFLRGYGLGWLDRLRYFWRIKKKQRRIYREAVSCEYRTILQQTSLSKYKH